jgi:hypothetical protein
MPSIATDILIEKMLIKLGHTDIDDLSEWIKLDDPSSKTGKFENLSYLKMLNSVNLKEPREMMLEGDLKTIHAPLGICSKSFGCYSSKKSFRQSDLEQLGTGVNSYFKMLKYL